MIQVGEHQVDPKPVTLKNAIEICFILAPYAAALRRIQPRILNAPDHVLRLVFSELSEEMRNAPGDLTRVFALLIDREPEWVARNITAEQFVMAVPELDKVNDLRGFILLIEELVNGAR